MERLPPFQVKPRKRKKCDPNGRVPMLSYRSPCALQLTRSTTNIYLPNLNQLLLVLMLYSLLLLLLLLLFLAAADAPAYQGMSNIPIAAHSLSGRCSRCRRRTRSMAVMVRNPRFGARFGITLFPLPAKEQGWPRSREGERLAWATLLLPA